MANGQSPSPAAWDVISGEGSAHTVLTVDFPGQPRREASFLDLAARLGSRYRFLHSIPPDARPCQRLSSAAYAGPWIDQIQREKRPVRAVLGHGVGCVYAAAIADGISGWQRSPKIILFDPQFPGVEFLGYELSKEIAANSSLLSDEEIARARKTVAAIMRSSTRDVSDIAIEIVEAYLQIITAAFERAGLGVARDSVLTSLFESYVAWVSVARQIDPGSAWRRSVAIVSSDYPRPTYREPRQDGGGSIGQLIPFQVRRADLLRCDSVARKVVSLLESAS